MTPAVNQVQKAKTPYTLHEYRHEESCESYGAEAAEKLGISGARVFKTLVVQLDSGPLMVAVLPVCCQLSMKQMAKTARAKKATMAETATVERATGYVLGGISPLGQRKKLKTLIDTSALQYPTVFVSAGRRGLEIELSPRDLADLTRARFAEICQ
jgi:Cys-tRNA(Pro)/Cys-tRNA(Cys) deacylase